MAASPDILDTLQMKDNASKLSFELQSMFKFFDQTKAGDKNTSTKDLNRLHRIRNDAYTKIIHSRMN